MNKRTRNMAIMLGACALCFGAYAISTATQDSQDTDADEATAAASLWDISSDEISGFSFTYGDNSAINLTNTDGTWQYADDGHFALNTEMAETMAEAIAAATYDRIIDSSEADLSAFGLKDSTDTLSFTDSSGTAHSLTFGNYNTAADAVYAVTDASDDVYMVPEDLKTAFEYELYDLLVTDEIPSTTADYLSGLTVSYGGNTYAYTYEIVEVSEDETTDESDGTETDESEDTETSEIVWYKSINGGEPEEFDSDEFATYVNYVLSLSVAGAADYYAGDTETLSSAYGIGALEITVNYVDPDTDEDLSYTLHFGNENEDGKYYFTIDDSLMVLTANSYYVDLIMEIE